MATSETQMATDFTSALKNHVEKWEKEEPVLDEETQKQIKALEKTASDLQGVDDDLAKKAADKAASLKPKKDEAQRKRQIAYALVVAAKGLGLQVVLNKNTQKALAGGGSKGGSGKRISKEIMAEGVAYLLDKAPEAKADAVAKDALKKPSLTDDEFNSVWQKCSNTEKYLSRVKGSRNYYLSAKGKKAK